MEEKIRNYLNQDFSPNGLTVEEIAKGIGSSNINLVEKATNNMFSNGSIIKYTHDNEPSARFRTQKLGQDLVGN